MFAYIYARKYVNCDDTCRYICRQSKYTVNLPNVGQYWNIYVDLSIKIENIFNVIHFIIPISY